MVERGPRTADDSPLDPGVEIVSLRPGDPRGAPHGKSPALARAARPRGAGRRDALRRGLGRALRAARARGRPVRVLDLAAEDLVRAALRVAPERTRLRAPRAQRER